MKQKGCLRKKPTIFLEEAHTVRLYTYVELETENRNPFVPGPSVSSSSVMMIIPAGAEYKSRSWPSQLASIFT